MDPETTPTAPPRSQLDVCLEQLGEAYEALSASYGPYMACKAAGQRAAAGEPIDGLSLRLAVDGVAGAVPVPMPEDPAQCQELLADACEFLGQEVVRLWREAQRVTTEAGAHCDAAEQRAAESGN